MEVIKTTIDGVLILEPKVFGDNRGYFFESFSQREFDEKVAPILGHTINFVQDNESMSSYGVMRGLHFQRPPFTQSKLVRCVKGAVLDVAVDIRKGSPTYGQHVAVELTEDNHRQFFRLCIIGCIRHNSNKFGSALIGTIIHVGYLYKSTLISNGLSKSPNFGCLVSFSERIALSAIRQSIPKESSRILMPPSASG